LLRCFFFIICIIALINFLFLCVRVHLFSEEEFLIGLGLMIGASEFSRKGNQLWSESYGHNQGEEAEAWESMISEPRFDQYMKLYHFKDLHCFLLLDFQCENLKEKGDPWWQFQWAVD
jgi:hypothetical protein